MQRVQPQRSVCRYLVVVAMALAVVVLSGASRQDGVPGPTTTADGGGAVTTTSSVDGEEPGGGTSTTSTTTATTTSTTASTSTTTSTSTTSSTTTVPADKGEAPDHRPDGQDGNSGAGTLDPGESEGDTSPEQVGPAVPGPGRPASVRSSEIPAASIALAVAVILAMAVGAWLTARRRKGDGWPQSPGAEQPVEPQTGQVELVREDLAQTGVEPDVEAVGDPTAVLPLENPAERIRLLNLLLSVGEALLDSGTAVPQVEATIKAISARFGVDNLSAIILPNSLILSLPHDLDVHTGTGTSGSLPLRLDQIDDVTRLVRRLLLGQVSVTDAGIALAKIRTSQVSTEPKLLMAGHAIAASAIVTILGGTWRELLIGCLLGGLVGALLVATRRFENIAYDPLQPLLVAAVSSIVVFACTRFIGGLIVFPLLIAPLVTFLPGGKLTMSVLELVTGHMVSGSARLMFGAMQLVLLAMGLAAGAQLVGAGPGVRAAPAAGLIAGIAPWVAVALFGVGIMLIHGVYESSRRWMLLVLYVAYAGQVIGALFFGSALSAFFGALAMTPVAILASRQPTGPSPLVTFLPAFWILVPGALGLRGVTMLIDGGGGVDSLLVVLTSMVGISLGILVGLALVTDNKSGWWIGDVPMAEPWLERKLKSWRE